MQKPPCWAVQCKDIPHYGERAFTTGAKAETMLKAFRDLGQWVPRNEALEANTEMRQIIPYVLVTRSRDGMFMALERMKSQEEARLHGNICLGAGGHMEPVDIDGDDLIEAAARREITEETGFLINELSFIGIICVTDPEAPVVHRVHAGVVYEAFTPQETFGGELEKQNPRWASRVDLQKLYPSMELWSKLVADGHIATLES